MKPVSIERVFLLGVLLAATPTGAYFPGVLPGHVGALPGRGGALSGQMIARSASIGDLTLTSVAPRIFTPNGDGYNDKVAFNFDNPEALPLSGTIYDLPGARVASLTGGTDQLTWDGKDSDGRTVPGGIYLYQIDFQGRQLTGTVVVAR